MAYQHGTRGIMNEAYFMDAGEQFLAHHGVKGMKWGVRRAGSGLANAGRATGRGVKRGAQLAVNYHKKSGELQIRGVKAVGRGLKRGVQASINYHKKSGELQIRGAKAVGRGVVKGAKAVGRGAKKVNSVVNRPLTDKERSRALKVGAAGVAGGLALAGASAAVGRSPGGRKALVSGVKAINGTQRIVSRAARTKKAYKTAARAAQAASAATHNRTYRNTATVIRGVRELTR